ncbi:MAG: response regulator transcription factor [Cyclobacteriaceae bacterium]
MSKIKILLVDDHKIVLEGIASLLSQSNEVKVVGKCQNAKDALGQLDKLKPDVIITDLNMPDYHGNLLIAEVKKKRPGQRVLVLTMHAEHFSIQQALKAGATGYVLKTCTEQELISAIKTVKAGAKYFSKDVAAILADESEDSDYGKISYREKEVLKLICQGLNSSEIGTNLKISGRTVDNHRAHIMRKLRVKNTAELVKKALTNHMV